MHTQLRLLVVLTGITAAVYAFSSGPLPKRTGVPVDGGLDCTACHKTYAPVNSDTRGRLTVQVAAYTPGVKQTIRVTLSHPEATRWGFQLTARLASDEGKQAGTFTVTDSVRVRCEDPAADSPCNGTLEFASHKRDDAKGIDSTHRGTTGSSSWDVEWTPPATDVGEVVFYAAGNAANNNGNFNGDRIYTTRVRTASAAGGCTFSGKPTISAVVSSASFQPGLGFNSMFTIFGSGFAAPGLKRQADKFDFVNDKFPFELGCLSVEVDGADVPVVYVDEHQINAEAPALVVSSSVKLEVRQNKGRPTASSAETTVPMQEFTPAFFSYGASKAIAAQHADLSTLASPSVVPGATPAKPGEIVVGYGTGFGVTQPVWQQGERPKDKAPVAHQFTVTVGGVTLRPEDVSYLGLTPTAISGLYQVNFRIPDSTPDGDIPVVVRIGGVATPDGFTIPVKR